MDIFLNTELEIDLKLNSMLKINEAAKEFSEKSVWACPISFKAGVEFAQRWISVEDELPSIGDHILIKLKRDKLKIWRIFNEDDRILVSNYATHWRPIELK